jgi:hypothetical protein
MKPYYPLLFIALLLSSCGYHLGYSTSQSIILKEIINKTKHRNIEVELYRLVIEEIRRTHSLSLSDKGTEVTIIVESCRGIPIYEATNIPLVGDLSIEITLNIQSPDSKPVKRTLSVSERYDDRANITLEMAKQTALSRLAQSIILELTSLPAKP